MNKVRKRKIFILVVGFLVLITFFVVLIFNQVNNPVVYQMKMLVKGDARQKIIATDFMKENKISEATQLLIDNVDSREVVEYEDKLKRTLSCASVQALEYITGEKTSDTSVCEEQIFKYDDLLNMAKRDWQNWYWNQQYQNWQVYRNDKLGFEIKYPEFVYQWGAECGLVNGEYLVSSGLVPVKILEDDNTISISQEYFYESSENGCQKVYNSPKHSNDERSWKIIIKNNIHSDEDLAVFIREFYGDKCQIGEKIISLQDGVYDVYLKWDGKSLDETECINNYASIFKHFPAQKKIAAWYIGMEYVIWGNSDGSLTFDEEMIKSFRFIE